MNLREISKERPNDIKQSDEVHKILEENFYKSKTENYQEIIDKETQIKGIDTIFDYNGFHYLCDEKAAVDWRNLKTYTLELSFIGIQNNVKEGWFVNDKLENNSYLFVWVEDEYIEYALIKKENIINYLDSLGWTKNALKIKAKRIRYNYNEPLGNIKKNNCRFIFTKNLVEKPINIQLPKSIYLNMADCHEIIYTKQFAGKGKKKGTIYQITRKLS